ncbi:MAG TPA: branched-chain amino acid transaminase [Gemmatimonadales bacterium]|nr:branched-chain amino acid transaminase [Gemmatimonadales bacterium]
MATITKTEWIWKEGEFIHWEDARIHLLSTAVQFGTSVFEGIRCYGTPDGPAIFRLQDHLRRLHDSCRIYRLETAWGPEQLAEVCCEIVRKNALEACYIRPMILRGYGAAGIDAIGSPVEAYVAAWPWGTYLGAGALENGVDACVTSWQRAAPNTFPMMAKAAGQYLNSQLMKWEAQRNGYHEAIAVGPTGLLSEGTGNNLFLVRKGVLITPEIDGTILAGITAETILTLARDLGIPTSVQQVPREMLYGADELFFTGTAAEVTPIRSVDRLPVGDGARGPITRVLQERYLGTAKGTLPDAHGWLTHARGAPGADRSGARAERVVASRTSG